VSAVARNFHYYVWYRVLAAPAEAQRAVAALQDDLARRTGIRGRVLMRRDDPATWMEIYEDVAAPAQFEPALAAAVERHRAADFAHDRARHTETFVAPD
jgi:hypothetical protein